MYYLFPIILGIIWYLLFIFFGEADAGWWDIIEKVTTEPSSYGIFLFIVIPISQLFMTYGTDHAINRKLKSLRDVQDAEVEVITRSSAIKLRMWSSLPLCLFVLCMYYLLKEWHSFHLVNLPLMALNLWFIISSYPNRAYTKNRLWTGDWYHYLCSFLSIIIIAIVTPRDIDVIMDGYSVNYDRLFWIIILIVNLITNILISVLGKRSFSIKKAKKEVSLELLDNGLSTCLKRIILISMFFIPNILLHCIPRWNIEGNKLISATLYFIPVIVLYALLYRKTITKKALYVYLTVIGTYAVLLFSLLVLSQIPLLSSLLIVIIASSTILAIVSALIVRDYSVSRLLLCICISLTLIGLLGIIIMTYPEYYLNYSRHIESVSELLFCIGLFTVPCVSLINLIRKGASDISNTFTTPDILDIIT